MAKRKSSKSKKSSRSSNGNSNGAQTGGVDQLNRLDQVRDLLGPVDNRILRTNVIRDVARRLEIETREV